MSLLLYGAMALAILGAVGGGVYKVKQWGANEVRAELQPQLDAANAAVQQQNAAIAATKAEGDRRVAAAVKGLKVAAEGTKAARSEAERLRALAAAPGAPGACPAGDAVAEVRRGLGK